MSHFKLSIPKSSCSPEPRTIRFKLDIDPATVAAIKKSQTEIIKHCIDAINRGVYHREAKRKAIATQGYEEAQSSVFKHMYAGANLQSTSPGPPTLVNLCDAIHAALSDGTLNLSKRPHTNVGKHPKLILAERLMYQLYPESTEEV